MSCPCGCGDDRARHFARPTGAQLGGSLAQRLIPIADRIRDLKVRFGFPPYEITNLRVSSSGGKRGIGVPQLVHELPLLPVPKIQDLGSLAEIVSPVGLVESGSILVSEISGAYSEDVLLGRDGDGNSVDADQEVLYEIEFTRPDGHEGERRRFNPASAPYYDAERVQWSLRLEKAMQNRARSGDLQ